MKNIKGPSGIINLTGKPGSLAKIIDCHSPDIYDNIESGILSTVKTLIDNGYLTYSSCEGHIESCPIRCVSILSNRESIRALQKVIHQIYLQKKELGRIEYFILEPKNNMYEDKFGDDALILDIIFGDIREKETEEKQLLFNEFISNHPYAKLEYDKLSEEETIWHHRDNATHIDIYM